MQESGQYLPRGAPVLVEYLPLLSSGLAFLVSSVSVAPQWPTLPAPRAASNLHSRIDEQIEYFQRSLSTCVFSCSVWCAQAPRYDGIRYTFLSWQPGSRYCLLLPAGEQTAREDSIPDPGIVVYLRSRSRFAAGAELSPPLSSRQIQQQLTIILSDAESVSNPERESPWSLLARLWWSFTQQASERL